MGKKTLTLFFERCISIFLRVKFCQNVKKKKRKYSINIPSFHWVITKAALISVAWDEITLCFYRDVVAIIFLIPTAFLIDMFFTSYL